jgi:hypothetical protein
MISIALYRGLAFFAIRRYEPGQIDLSALFPWAFRVEPELSPREDLSDIAQTVCK